MGGVFLAEVVCLVCLICGCGMWCVWYGIFSRSVRTPAGRKSAKEISVVERLSMWCFFSQSAKMLRYAKGLRPEPIVKSLVKDKAVR